MSRAAVLFALALVCIAIGCDDKAPDPLCGSAFGRALSAVVNAPGALFGGSLGCGTGNGALYTGQAVTAPGGPCAPTSGDDPCVACARASCCMEGLAFAADPFAGCLVNCRVAGKAVAECSSASECGPAPATYNAVTTCLASDCTTECPGVP